MQSIIGINHKFPSLVLILFSTLVAGCTGYSTQALLDGKFVEKDLSPVDLLAPADKSIASKNPKFAWTKRSGAMRYLLEMSAKSDFSDIILRRTTSETSYTLQNGDLATVSQLDALSYYWRITAEYSDQKVVSATAIFHVLDDVVIFVNANSTASNQVGNKSFPIKILQAAIETANTRRNGVATTAMTIRVAAGTYAEEISLRPGISLLGGHESTLWSRNIAANPTYINAPTDAAINGNSAITAAYKTTTVVDGFTITGGAATKNYGILLVSASPTITNNTISGGSSSSSHGIYNDLSSPTISNNSISGGTGTNTYGIYNDSSSAIISNNTINGGSGTSNSYGIYVNNSSPTISNNLITGGNGAAANKGIESANTSSPAILNNTIHGGTTGTNNHGVTTTGGATPAIKNNIIFGTTAGTDFCVVELTSVSSPTVFQNNNIYGCASRYYGNFVGGGGNCPSDPSRNCYTLVTDLNDNLKTTGAAGTAGGNDVIDNAGNQLFVDFDGADNNINTMADNNWHLTTNAAICNVRGGGLDLSGSITTDKDGLTRTISTITGCTPSNAGATNWSIGAYESN